MKKSKLLVAVLSVFLITGIQNANAQFSKLKDAVNKPKSNDKGNPSKGNDKGAFSELNSETDDLGITGQYFGLKDPRSFGFKFVKEAEGKLVNQLHYWEKKAAEPQIKMELKESYYTKNNVKFFYIWINATSSGYVELIEVDPGVMAQISQTQYSSNGGPAPLEANRKVVDVYAKDKASFDTWDIETAQAKVDMLIATLKGAEGEKIKKNLMKYEVYSNYKGKIAFTKATNVLRNQKDHEPIEKKENFITKGELGNTIAWKPYFEQPLEQSHPGAWFNITYEMEGVTTDREKLRKESTVFSKNIPQIDKDKNLYYFYFPRVIVDRSNNVADYAFLELLRLIQDKLKVGQVYDLKVTVWAYKDGANIDPVATGTIQLEYTKEEEGTKKYLTEPVHGWISKIETLLDE